MKCACCSAAGNYNTIILNLLVFGGGLSVALTRAGAGNWGLGFGGAVVLDQEGSVAVSLAQQRSRLEILRLLFNFSLTQRLDIRSF